MSHRASDGHQRRRRCGRSRSAIPPSPIERRDDGTDLSAAEEAARRLSGPHRPTACITGPTRSRTACSWPSATPAAAGGRSPTRSCWIAARHIASALLARGLSAERPIVILSGNSIDHALLAFGALYAGIPFCPVSPAYSLVSKDYGKLAYLMKLLTPGLVFADDADEIRRCAGRQRSRRHRDRGVARRRARPQGDDARRAAGDAGASAASTPRTTRSARIRSPNSC